MTGWQWWIRRLGGATALAGLVLIIFSIAFGSPH